MRNGCSPAIPRVHVILDDVDTRDLHYKSIAEMVRLFEGMNSTANACVSLAVVCR